MIHHREPGTGATTSCGKKIAKGIRCTADWSKVDCPECSVLQGAEDWTEAQRQAAGIKEEKTVETKPVEGAKLAEVKTPKTKTVHLKEEGQVKAPCGKPVGLTGQAASLNSPSSTKEEEVTCKGCLAVLESRKSPKKKAAHKTAPKVTIECADCGEEREIFEYQVGIVTRCQECQEAHIKAKLRAKNKARRKAKMKEKKGTLREEAMDLLHELALMHPEAFDNGNELVSMLATLIREQYPLTKIKKEKE